MSATSLVILLLLNTAGFSAFAQHISQKTAKTEELRLALENLSLRIDARVSTLKMIAKNTANDAHIHYSLNKKIENEDAPILVEKLGFLVKEYGLTSASFADKSTNRYWNHEGFLRVLDPKIDTWYFAYLAGKQQDLVSVYHDKNKHRVDLYVNYQQLNGTGLSGIATSFNSIVDMLTEAEIARFGEVYLVDTKGTIQIHPDMNVAGTLNISQIFSDNTGTTLLKHSSNLNIKIVRDKNASLIAGSAYIPSMDWFVVVDFSK